MGKKALLMILDGWGMGTHEKSNAIYSTPTPYWDSLLDTYPHSLLKACGEDVGLPDGQMGNSEVGHLNIGGGRVLTTALRPAGLLQECNDSAPAPARKIPIAVRAICRHGLFDLFSLISCCQLLFSRMYKSHRLPLAFQAERH